MDSSFLACYTRAGVVARAGFDACTYCFVDSDRHTDGNHPARPTANCEDTAGLEADRG
ncbi:MAG: hypothetical protein OXH98_12860 [Caldilineaceae bacterium]|nr:hypothetical protein [Caldilineaceae bacterium]